MKVPELYVHELDLLQSCLLVASKVLKDDESKIEKVKLKLTLLMPLRTPPWRWKARKRQIDRGAIEARKEIGEYVNRIASLSKKLNESTVVNKDKNGNDVILTLSEYKQLQTKEAIQGIVEFIKKLT
jgi:hypothetical protein